MRGMVNVPSARKRGGITVCLTSVAKCEKCGVSSCARVTLIRIARWQIYSGKIYLSLHPAGFHRVDTFLRANVTFLEVFKQRSTFFDMTILILHVLDEFKYLSYMTLKLEYFT